ncbi:iron ABC transporter substrate-binding protein [Cereibacter changlensis JA139]|uniref:Iron ABC transporter substrate-binding protein n=2 Tax=Cereibacter changlensis TaxID=402884 RepID=A0A2T4JPK7_9RHOB|nr:extracellular solute-binding protein [Cereibacter changlensis]PTE19852.1 iron ABC transporter substrate-binding protein [Cereibacter changlensis JA139]PZX49989.1 putative spermidine/putrescine transport system substrate-binding protein [Cereibacter changlensis]
MNRRDFLATISASALLAALPAHAFDGAELYPGEKALYDAALQEGLIVSFDTGPTWANWAGQFKAFKERYPGVEMVYNDLGSAATVVALDKSRNRPQADTAYYFAGSALDAVNVDVVEGYKPVNFDRLPEALRETDGKWFAIHQLNVAFLVNTKLVQNVPHSWADLMKSEYRNAIVYQDPRSTGQGQVVVFAAAFGNGGDMDNVQPGIEYLGGLTQAGNVLRTVGTTPYAQFVKGEIPIWIGYENDGLKAEHLDGMGDDIAVVTPAEASAAAPYAISLVKGGPNPNAGKLWLNFVMSDFGQQIFAQGFVRPSVPGIELPAEVADKMPLAPQVTAVDIALATAKKPEIDAGWAKAVLGQ